MSCCCVRMCVCVCECGCACVRVCVGACVGAGSFGYQFRASRLAMMFASPTLADESVDAGEQDACVSARAAFGTGQAQGFENHTIRSV